MPALSYKKQVARYVEDGTKPHTVRMERKRPIKAGDTLYHYEAMRTKHCRFLGASICTAVKKIEIKSTGLFVDVTIDGYKLSWLEIEDFIFKDGFRCANAPDAPDWDAFLNFFFPTRKSNVITNHTFIGVVIYFNPLKPNRDSDK